MDAELLQSVERELLRCPGVHTERRRFNSTTFRVGRREIGHVHGNGVADLPFPKAVYEALIAGGRAQPHHFGVRGFVSFAIGAPGDIAAVIALFRLNYDRATATAAARGAA